MILFYSTIILLVISGITGFIVYKKADKKLQEKSKEIDKKYSEALENLKKAKEKNLKQIKAERIAYNKEEQEKIEEFVQHVKEVDAEIAEQYEDLLNKNSVVFDCPCNHNSIRTFIDLSKEENTFICPECKNEYRVDIHMTPILKGKIIDERNLYNLLSQTVQENKGN